LDPTSLKPFKGKTDAAREIGDRLEGKARQQIELSGRDGGPIDLAERIARARKRAGMAGGEGE
jgi:hypothetical protein